MRGTGAQPVALLHGAAGGYAGGPGGAEPAAAGPSGDAAEGSERERVLEAQVAALEEELQCALESTELALAMPRLLKQAGSKKMGSSGRSGE